MTATIETDVCVLGSGPVAAALASGAAQLGMRTMLVPTPGGFRPQRPVVLKALAEAGRVAAAVRSAPGFGIVAGAAAADWAAVRRHAEEAASGGEPDESRERLTALGVTVGEAPGRFIGPRHLAVAGQSVRARRFFIVPGPAAMPAEDALLSLPELPERLTVAGGGPTAFVLAQVLARLGCAVALRPAGPPLEGFDRELAALLMRKLAVDGVGLDDGPGVRITAEEVLPAVADLGLSEAGIAWDARIGIQADGSGRTGNPRVWAAPRGANHPSATAAGLLAGAVLRLPARLSPPVRVAFTDPELVQVGLDEESARALGVAFRLLRWPLGTIEQARAERRPDGVVKVVIDRRGRVLGVGILAPRAADMAVPWIMAVRKRLPAAEVAAAAPASPTFADAGRLAAASAVLPLLLGGRAQRWARLMMTFA
ncbi:MAG: FAD-dependent oxidoreductase [Magnetospirillum sp.]|nr:FAD-dependent oxidoreductase [Magnetospirillum sp.]